MRCTSGWLRWGFCAMRSPLTACRRRVGALDGVIPPFAGGGATSRGGVAAKLQTHWGKRVQKRLFWLNGSAIWRSWWVWTHRLRYSALQARRMRVGSVSWAPRLAPLTRSCAAKPHWWHGGQPAQAATYRVNVRGKEPRPPPIGFVCACERGLMKLRLYIGASRRRVPAGTWVQMPALNRIRQPWPRARLVRRTWVEK